MNSIFNAISLKTELKLKWLNWIQYLMHISLKTELKLKWLNDEFNI